MFATANDIAGGLQHWRLWLKLASDDLRLMFRRTSIGVLWYSLSFAILIGAKLAIFSAMTTKGFEYYALYLSIGLLVWQYVTGLLVDGCNIYTGAVAWVTGVKLPRSVFAFRSLTRQTVIALYRSAPVVALFIAFSVFGHGTYLSWHAITVLPAIVITITGSFFLTLMLGALCARHRDLVQIITNAVSVSLFLSPILWTPDQLLHLIGKILYWNPLTHYLAIFRAPLIDHSIPYESWEFVAAMTVGLIVLAIPVFSATRKRIVYWV